MPNILVYKDVSGPPGGLIARVNGMCGAILTDPRPDMRGDYIIEDILSAQIIATSSGFGILAVLSLRKDPPQVPYRFFEHTEVGLLADVGEDAEIVMP